jgi:hypothetical protein
VRRRPALRGWIPGALAALIAFRIALAGAVLARSGHRLMAGFPVYRFNPTPGDAYAYYFGARELVQTWQRHVLVIAPVALLGTVSGVLLVIWSRRAWRERGVILVVGLAWVVGVLAALLAGLSRFSGAPSIGWPLVWSVPLLPYRALRLPLDPNVAFAIALVLWTGFIAAVVIALYVLGLGVSRRREVALSGAALYAFWPLLALVLGGHRGTGKGTWQNDVGLSAVSEPLSTALVVSALAFVVSRPRTPMKAGLAGGLLGLATAVRLSNGVIAACVVISLLVVRERGRAVAAIAAGAAFVPVVAAYWPKGYVALPAETFHAHPFALGYARAAWTESLLWHPSVLIALIPVALLGTVMIERRSALLLWGCVAANALFYTFYYDTPLHPRFMFVVLPIVLMFWAAGALTALSTPRLALDRRR